MIFIFYIFVACALYAFLSEWKNVDKWFNQEIDIILFCLLWPVGIIIVLLKWFFSENSRLTSMSISVI